MPVIIVILIISFLVIIHELGHLVAAKKARVRVEEFGVGYPPRLLKLFKWGETVFSLNLIPVGGFVRLEGEELPAGEVQEGREVLEGQEGQEVREGQEGREER
ncbi:MAG: RIP metalloprotease RseP, partial [Candidatus Pacebacteria bacterium]|nr:RIP metalloprotease RseP [Candidatus Paceibacterota bacterium]